MCIKVITLLALIAGVEPTVEAVEPAEAERFVMPRGRVVVSVWINEVGPYPFLVDTGGALNVVDAPLAEFLGLVPDEDKPKAVDGLEVWKTQALSLRVAGRTVPAKTLLVADLAPLEEQLGFRVAGILGNRALPGQFVLDFGGRRFIPGKGAGEGRATVPLRFEGGSGPLVAGRVNETAQRFVIDTSFGGVAALPRSLAEELGLLSEGTARLSLMGGKGVPGALQVRVPSVIVGEAKVADPLCVVDDGAARLGTGFLKHFRVAMDFEAGTLALIPLQEKVVEDPPVTGVGLGLNRRTNGLWSVRVAESSPAQEAGVQSGDRILKIDGHPMEGESYEGLHKRLAVEPGVLVETTVLRGTEELTFDLVAVELL